MNKKVTNMIDFNPTTGIITLNMNGLNMPVKRQRLSKWIKKQDSIIYCLQDTDYKAKEWKKTY